MSWFEAYMLWRLDTLQGACLGVLVACGVYWFAGWVAILCEGNWLEDDTKQRLVYWFKRTAIIGGVCCFLLIFVPSTTDLFKIIATKKGVDAIQSETAGKYLSEVDKAVTNGFKILNQEIEKKLDKKVGK